MTVIKVRDVADLRPPASASSAEANLRAAFELVELCYRLRPWHVRRGVERLPDRPTATRPAAPR
jgi:hypothetical protein